MENITDFLRYRVLNRMAAGTSFTSLDITNRAKQAGYRVHNRYVAEWLRENVIVLAHGLKYLYNQSLIKVDSKKDGFTLAYLYHHYQEDPDEYMDRDQNPQSWNAIPTSPRTVGPLPTVGFNNPMKPLTTPPTMSNHWKTQKRDAAGRFC
jgi:hypothetical protein